MLLEVLAYYRWHTFRYLGSMLVYFVFFIFFFKMLVLFLVLFIFSGAAENAVFLLDPE